MDSNISHLIAILFRSSGSQHNRPAGALEETSGLSKPGKRRYEPSSFCRFSFAPLVSEVSMTTHIIRGLPSVTQTQLSGVTPPQVVTIVGSGIDERKRDPYTTAYYISPDLSERDATEQIRRDAASTTVTVCETRENDMKQVLQTLLQYVIFSWDSRRWTMLTSSTSMIFDK